MKNHAPTRLSPRAVWAAFAFFAAAPLVYLRALSGAFIWDDDGHVTAPVLRSLGGLWRIWTDLTATQQYYPLLHSAFWLEQALWGDAVLGYHLVNVFFHVCAAVLFALALRELRVPGAWLAAAFFLLHPVHVESVAWVSELKNTLSATLYLGALLAYLRFDRERGWRAYLLASGFFAAALLTKTVTATLPAALLVIFWWRRGTLSLRRDVVPLVPWFVAGLAAGLFTAWVERTLIGASGVEFELSFFQRLELSGRVVAFYFTKLIWPSNLAFVYPRWTIEVASFAGWLPLVAVLGVSFGCWRLRHVSRAPLAVLLLFAGTLVPVLGFLNVYPFRYSFVADHFQYLASLAVIAGGTALATMLLPAMRTRRVLASAALAALALCSHLQCRQYRDPETLWRVTLARNPSAAMAWVHLGQIRSKAGDHQEALAHFRRAAELNPYDYDAENNLGCELILIDRAAESRPHFKRALALNPISPDVHNNFGYALALLGDRRSAIAHYQAALRVRPNFADAHNNLGVALTEEGRAAEAISHLEKAVALEPASARAHHNLGNALRQAGRAADAIASYERALRADPTLAETHDELGLALLGTGQIEAALMHFETALRLRPELVSARVNLGQALGRAGRVAEALQQFEAATRAAPDDLAALLGQGQALSALERWREAREVFARAVAAHETSTEARRSFGMALANTGAMSESLQQFEAAIRLEPNSAENHLAIAQVLTALGREREAAQHRVQAETLGRRRE